MSARLCPECGLPLGPNPRQERHKRCANRRDQRKLRETRRALPESAEDVLLAALEHWCWLAACRARTEDDKWLAFAAAIVAAGAPGEYVRLANSLDLHVAAYEEAA